MTSTRTALRTRLHRLRRRRQDERGAYAILVSMMMLMVMALAAIAVDIASQVESKQRLKDTMDAAAHAAAFELPEGVANISTVVRNVARASDPTANPTVDTWCVVAAKPDRTVNATQIPNTCNPGKGTPYTASNYPGLRCGEVHCFIPCNPSLASAKCNTVRVADEKVVPYKFAPAIGFDEGSTGAVVSVACKGSCGTAPPNPMDVVVVADRTPSMGTYLPPLRDSIRSMIAVMDPSMHFLALGTIDAAANKPTSTTLLANTNCQTVSTANQKARPDPGGSPSAADMRKGWWMATQFSNTYSTPSGSTFVLNDRDRVTNAVKCLEFSPASGGSYYRTHLAAPLRAAAQHLWDENATNLHALSAAANRPGDVKKVIIFETDGAPLESQGQTGNTNVSTVDSQMGTYEPRNTGAAGACTNLKNVATAAKAKGTLIITVGFGDAATGSCGSEKISSVLASVATDSATTGCDTQAKRTLENNDGDYFFCATTGAELAPIFTTAFGQLTTGVKLLKMPT